MEDNDVDGVLEGVAVFVNDFVRVAVSDGQGVLDALSVAVGDAVDVAVDVGV